MWHNRKEVFMKMYGGNFHQIDQDNRGFGTASNGGEDILADITIVKRLLFCVVGFVALFCFGAIGVALGF